MFQTYNKQTKQGHKITQLGTYQNKTDFGTKNFFVVFYRKEQQDYNIALNYNFYEGTWAQGIYDFKDEESAILWLAKNKQDIKLYR